MSVSVSVPGGGELQVPVLAASSPNQAFYGTAPPAANFVPGYPFGNYGGSVQLSPRFAVPTRGQKGSTNMDSRLNEMLYGNVNHSLSFGSPPPSLSHTGASINIPVPQYTGASVNIPMGLPLGNPNLSASMPSTAASATSSSTRSRGPPTICWSEAPPSSRTTMPAAIRPLSPTSVSRLISCDFDMRRAATPNRLGSDRQFTCADRSPQRSMSPPRRQSPPRQSTPRMASHPVTGNYQPIFGMYSTSRAAGSREAPRIPMRQQPPAASRRAATPVSQPPETSRQVSLSSVSPQPPETSLQASLRAVSPVSHPPSVPQPPSEVFFRATSPTRACSSPTAIQGDVIPVRTQTVAAPASCRSPSPVQVSHLTGAFNLGTGALSQGSSLALPMPVRWDRQHSQPPQPWDRPLAQTPRTQLTGQTLVRTTTGATSVERAPVSGPSMLEARVLARMPVEGRRPLAIDTSRKVHAPESSGSQIQNGQSGEREPSPCRRSSASSVLRTEELSLKYVERPNPFLALLPKETREIIDRITHLLGDRDVLKNHVVICFKKAVAGEGTDLIDDELDIAALHLFRDFLAEELQVPSAAFGDLEVEQIRFDFTGTGTLSVNEAYRLVKFHLRQYRKQLGGAPVTVDIPFRSLQLAGFTITKELGAGSQGTAKLAHNALGAEFCIKCYRKDKMNAGGLEELKEEFEALQLLHCNSIAGAFEMFQDAHSFYMVGEAFYGGDFLTLKQRAKAQNVVLNEQWWRGVFKQCFEALAFMHKQAMIHCDIKEPNVMVKTSDFRQPQVVVIDLGVAKAMAASDDGIPHGTPGYVPPETWETKKWFPTGDVFSLGVVIIQLMIDKSPPSGPRTKDTPGGIFVEGCANIREIFLATQTRPPPIHLMPKDMPDLSELAEKCLEKKMGDRPRSVEALKMPFFGHSQRRKKSSLDLGLNPRNRFATVGITKQFLAKYTSQDEDIEEEDEDDEDDDVMKQKKQEMKNTLQVIQEAARLSGHTFELELGSDELQDSKVEESSTLATSSANASIELKKQSPLGSPLLPSTVVVVDNNLVARCENIRDQIADQFEEQMGSLQQANQQLLQSLSTRRPSANEVVDNNAAWMHSVNRLRNTRGVPRCPVSPPHIKRLP